MRNPKFNESFGNSKFDPVSHRVLVTVMGSSSLISEQGKMQMRSVSRNIRRETRRKETRYEVLEVNKDSKLSSSEKQARKDNLAILYTMGSLDDNQETQKIIQDLGACNVFPPDTSRIYLEEQVNLRMGCVPTYILPPRCRSFRLYVENNAGIKRVLNDPVTNMALPVQEVQIGHSNTEAKGHGTSEPYASIMTAFLNRSDGTSVTVTVLDLRTDEIQTFTSTKNNLEVQECLQGVNPDIKSVRLDPSPAKNTYIGTTLVFLVQLVIFYTLLTPLATTLSSFVFDKK